MRTNPLQLRNKLPARLRALITLAKIGNTTRRLWQIVFGDSDTELAEVFGPLGYAARPAARGARAVVVRAGDGTVSAVVALQDAQARIVELAEDERAIFNDAAHILVKANGIVEIARVGGTGQPVAFKSDCESLDRRVTEIERWVNAHVHPLPEGGSTSAVSTPSATAAEIVGSKVAMVQ